MKLALNLDDFGDESRFQSTEIQTKNHSYGASGKKEDGGLPQTDVEGVTALSHVR